MIIILIPYREERTNQGKLKIFNGLPLSRNKYLRLHHFARDGYNKRWYGIIKDYLMEFNHVKIKCPVHFTITVYACGNLQDINNPEDKFIVDAFVKAGKIPDDSLEYMPRRPEFKIVRVEHRDEQKTVIELSEVSSE